MFNIGPIIAAVFVLAAPASALGQVEADLEAGVVFSGRNDTRIPGDGGSDLSLVNDLSTSPAPVSRLRLGYRIADRHLITALYAPLRLNARGQLDRDVSFMGSVYPAGTRVLAVYRFDSYRLTYRYSL